MSETIKHTPRLWSRDTDQGRYFLIWCAGCGHGHTIPTPRWGFNGNFKSPSFTPSVRHFITHPETGQEQTICHYIVTDGKMQYCSDCRHQLNGQSIDLPDLPPDYGF